MKKTLLFPLASLLPLAVRAHEGHGLGGAHWHASDAWGFVVGGVAVAAAAIWWRGRK
jgi:hypothetical protein